MSEQVVEGAVAHEQSRVIAAEEALMGLLQRMGSEVSIEVCEGEEQIDLSIGGPDAAALIGTKGKTLDALQFLVNKMLGGRDDDHKLIVVDSDGYRERREASLVDMAHKLSDKALKEGKIVRLNPLSPRDRRIVHMTLREMEGISTRSEGDGEDRRLLIIPEP